MSDKISPVAIVKEAVGTFRHNPTGYLLLISMAVLVDYGIAWVSVLPEEASHDGLVVILLAICVTPWLYRRIIHCTIQTLRGKEEPVGKLWKFVLGLIAVKILTKFLAFVGGFLPSVGLGVLFGAEHVEMILMLVSEPIGVIVLLRYGFVLTAIAVDDHYDYSLAWRLGKGHTLRMILTALPLLLAFVCSGFFLLSGDGSAPSVFDPLWFSMSVVTGALSVFTLMMYSAWYVRLRERYEVVRKTTVQEEEGATVLPSTDADFVQNQEA
ncbi:MULTISPECIES: hypothetical protein [unclassified Pseudodesulfovibrio]|uniref:hypothetical protein n=1 Tax=unclassified Pseudodesulfovibrio TaxID=2661612 RepID=UPI000FEBE1EA|nr:MULTISPECIES: hypothetical protein [unclassified Pseudodesulfovibrio]MCJ2165332.1 hypothetical protein [Pseudodesulfovibrio sp. S3-i]RWU02797.1 hypothetical protein DWB63_14160 [Pseudodesulfovibrio sp. S3]